MRPQEPEDRRDFHRPGEGCSGDVTCLVVPERRIVQACRAYHWKRSDEDSILVVQFSKAPEPELWEGTKKCRVRVSHNLFRSLQELGAGMGRVGAATWILARAQVHLCQKMHKISPAFAAEGVVWPPRFLATADEMDNFVAIVRLDFGFVPFQPGKNSKITLNRNAAAVHSKVVEQPRDSQAIRDFRALAIDRDDQGAASV